VRRTIVELLFLAIGLSVAVLIACAATWAVGGISRTVWPIAFVAMAVEVLLQIGPVRRAWRADRAARAQTIHNDG
jgi:hypothetical protein